MKPVLFLVLSTSLLLTGCNNTATAPDTFVYNCESGVRITASYPDTDSARVTYLGREHSMRIDVSASGSRYVGDLLEWWTKGTSGTLLQRSENGGILEQCNRRS